MGKRVANAPNLTLDANVRYELPHLANGLRPYVQVSDSYQSTEFFENNNYPLSNRTGVFIDQYARRHHVQERRWP